MVSREFADARENRPDARSAMNRHNNEAGRVVSNFFPTENNKMLFHSSSGYFILLADGLVYVQI